MSSTIQVYSSDVVVEEVTGQRVFGTVEDVVVTLKDVDVGDFTSEYSLDEVLDQYEFSDIHDWVIKRLEE